MGNNRKSSQSPLSGERGEGGREGIIGENQQVL